MEGQIPSEQSAFSTEIESVWENIRRFAKNPVYLGITIVFLLSVGVSSYILFFWHVQSPVSHNPANLALPAKTPAPTQTVQSVPLALSPTPVATTAAYSFFNWKTYTSTRSGYTVQYPKDWIASASASTDPLITDLAIFRPATSSASTKAITVSTTTRTAAELLSIYGNNGTALTIASQSATEYDRKDSDGNQSVSIILTESSVSYVFYSLSQYRSLLLQMLTTFQLSP